MTRRHTDHRGLALVAVLVVMGGALLVATSLLFVVHAEMAGCSGAAERAQTRALARSELWDPDARISRKEVPTAGQMTRGAKPSFDAEGYDAALPARQKATLY